MGVGEASGPKTDDTNRLLRLTDIIAGQSGPSSRNDYLYEDARVYALLIDTLEALEQLI